MACGSSGKEINWRGERQFFISPHSAFGTLIQVWDGLGGPGAGQRVRVVLKVVFFDAAGTLFEPREPVGRELCADRAKIRGRRERRARSAPPSGGSSIMHPVSPSVPAADARNCGGSSANGGASWSPQPLPGLGSSTHFDGYFAELFAFFADPANWSADPQARAGACRNCRTAGSTLGMVSNFDYRLYAIFWRGSD